MTGARREPLYVALAAVAVLSLGVVSAPSSALGQGSDALFRKDFVVTTRDGVELPATFIRPKDVPRGRSLPVIAMAHGGGAAKGCEGDMADIERFARAGYLAVMYTARGHALLPFMSRNDCGTPRTTSDPAKDMFDVFGPKTASDFYDVLNATLEDPESKADPSRIGVWGASQGGGTINVATAWQHETITDTKPGSAPVEVNPYGIDIDATAPWHSFYDLYRALAPNDCYKIAFGTFIFTYSYTTSGAVVDPYFPLRWGPAFMSGLEQARDAVKPDMKLRSPKTYARALGKVPGFWVQAFDDVLFPTDEAVDWFDDGGVDKRLWLSWGGHAAPAGSTSDQEIDARRAGWFDWFDARLKGKRSDRIPRVTYWYHDPADNELVHRATATDWPPPGTRSIRFYLAPGGQLSRRPAEEPGSHTVVNSPAVQDLNSDPVVRTAGEITRIGALLPQSARTPAETAVFSTPELERATLLAGAPSLEVHWTSSGREVQANALLWDVYPDGRRWLISRGCTLLPNDPGEARTVQLDLFHSVRLLEAGHRLELWLSPVAQPTFRVSNESSVNVISFSAEERSRVRVPLLRHPPRPPRQRAVSSP